MRQAKPDIEDVLALEIKRDLAERYFGFRRLIEKDKQELDRKVRHQTISLEQQICFDLARLYILLGDEMLIDDFLALAGLQEKLFFDPYLAESPTIRRRLFQGVKRRGLTKAGRFRNLALDCYESLTDHVNQYRAKLGELVEAREVINEEIKLFRRKNDIGLIMGFLRGLNGASPTHHGPMGGGLEVGLGASVDRNLQVEPPPPIETLLPIIPPLVPAPEIRDELKKLTDLAYKLHGRSFLSSLTI